jgi:hypothetical protein
LLSGRGKKGVLLFLLVMISFVSKGQIELTRKRAANWL